MFVRWDAYQEMIWIHSWWSDSPAPTTWASAWTTARSCWKTADVVATRTCQPWATIIEPKVHNWILVTDLIQAKYIVFHTCLRFCNETTKFRNTFNKKCSTDHIFLGEIMIQRRFFVFLIQIMTAMLKDIQFSWTLQNLSESCRKTVKQQLSDQIEF